MGLLFCSGDYVLTQQVRGQLPPAQCAGVAVIMLALLAPRLHRHPQQPEAGEAASRRLQSAIQLGHKLLCQP